MTTSPPHKRARTSSPSAPAPRASLPIRADIALLSSEARLDLILALLDDNPAAASIVTSHITTAERRARHAQVRLRVAAEDDASSDTTFDYSHLLAKVKPRLEQVKMLSEDPEEDDKDTEKLEGDVKLGLGEMLFGCRISDHPETRFSALTAMAAIARSVIDSPNEYIRRDAAYLGNLVADGMTEVLQSVNHPEEKKMLTAEFSKDADELENLYDRHAEYYEYGFSDVIAILSIFLDDT